VHLRKPSTEFNWRSRTTRSSRLPSESQCIAGANSHLGQEFLQVVGPVVLVEGQVDYRQVGRRVSGFGEWKRGSGGSLLREGLWISETQGLGKACFMSPAVKVLIGANETEQRQTSGIRWYAEFLSLHDATCLSRDIAGNLKYPRISKHAEYR
jgi:hypothetical protein